MTTRIRPAVALLIETSNRYSRELLRGIHTFIHENGLDWSLHLTEQGRGSNPPPWWNGWQGQGIIARIENKKIEKAVTRKKIPVICVSASGLGKDFPTVISDSEAVSSLAADHLIERGFRFFGYCGDIRFGWSETHGRNFERALKNQGFDCYHFKTTMAHITDHDAEHRDLVKWLKSLPKPIGLMACFDSRGQQLLECCRQAGIKVPDEAGVIGQHDDSLLCELCDPPLSSVIPNPHRAGMHAASLLHRRLKGRTVKPATVTIPPLGVSCRQSTDFVSSGDPELSRAMQFIRDHALEGINVSDLLDNIPMSRTLLERKFRSTFGRSPYEAILAIRFRQAELFLARSDMRIAEVAEKSGFASAEYFSAVFRKKAGMSPRDFRDKFGKSS